MSNEYCLLVCFSSQSASQTGWYLKHLGNLARRIDIDVSGVSVMDELSPGISCAPSLGSRCVVPGERHGDDH